MSLSEEKQKGIDILKVILAKANAERKLVYYVATNASGEEEIFVTTKRAARERKITLAPGQELE
jgi:hypothetical protein